jgi:thiol-disulfide isomerase/thioredoxin
MIQKDEPKMKPILEINEPEFEREVLSYHLPVLVNFWADWSQPCRRLGPVLEEVAAGNRICLAAKIKVGLPAERLQRLRTLFSAAAVHFRMRQGGTAILNLKNLVRFTFNPGPDVTPSNAWPAHHLSRQQGSMRIAGALDWKDPVL